MSPGEIQRTLLPPPLVHPRLDLAAEFLPAREIGGDYYDAILLERGRLALALGDVSTRRTKPEGGPTATRPGSPSTPCSGRCRAGPGAAPRRTTRR